MVCGNVVYSLKNVILNDDINDNLTTYICFNIILEENVVIEIAFDYLCYRIYDINYFYKLLLINDNINREMENFYEYVNKKTDVVINNKISNFFNIKLNEFLQNEEIKIQMIDKLHSFGYLI